MIRVILWRQNYWHLKSQSFLILPESHTLFYRIILNKYHITLIKSETFYHVVELFHWVIVRVSTWTNQITTMTRFLPFEILKVKIHFLHGFSRTQPDIKRACFLLNPKTPNIVYASMSFQIQYLTNKIMGILMILH